jgi:hypothetical protein
MQQTIDDTVRHLVIIPNGQFKNTTYGLIEYYYNIVQSFDLVNYCFAKRTFNEISVLLIEEERISKDITINKIISNCLNLFYNKQFIQTHHTKIDIIGEDQLLRTIPVLDNTINALESKHKTSFEKMIEKLEKKVVDYFSEHFNARFDGELKFNELNYEKRLKQLQKYQKKIFESLKKLEMSGEKITEQHYLDLNRGILEFYPNTLNLLFGYNGTNETTKAVNIVSPQIPKPKVSDNWRLSKVDVLCRFNQYHGTIVYSQKFPRLQKAVLYGIDKKISEINPEEFHKIIKDYKQIREINLG